MTVVPLAPALAAKEAREWWERLGRRSITADELLAFREWRARPENAEAYDRLVKR